VRRRDHPGAEAQALGLVNKVVPLASFAEEFGKFLAVFTGLSGASLRATKRAIRAGQGASLRRRPGARRALYLDELDEDRRRKEAWRRSSRSAPPVWRNR